MAVFGLPDAHEDDALRAVRAAAAMRDGMDDAERRASSASSSVRLAIRTGITTGEAVTGDPTLRSHSSPGTS